MTCGSFFQNATRSFPQIGYLLELCDRDTLSETKRTYRYCIVGTQADALASGASSSALSAAARATAAAESAGALAADVVGKTSSEACEQTDESAPRALALALRTARLELTAAQTAWVVLVNFRASLSLSCLHNGLTFRRWRRVRTLWASRLVRSDSGRGSHSRNSWCRS